MMKTLNQLRDEALAIATAHGFTDASVGEDLMLMVSELAEALEDYRAGRDPAALLWETKYGSGAVIVGPEKGPGDKPVGIPSEMADVIIRVLHFCGKHKIDIEKAVEEKMAYNAARPFKHGGKKL